MLFHSKLKTIEATNLSITITIRRNQLSRQKYITNKKEKVRKKGYCWGGETTRKNNYAGKVGGSGREQ